MEPGIEVDPAAKRAEAVIGKNEESSFAPGVIRGFPDESIHAPVQVLDDARVLPVPVLELPVKHVLNAIAGIENACDHATPCFLQSAQKHALPLLENVPRLFQERVTVDDALVQCPGILG